MIVLEEKDGSSFVTVLKEKQSYKTNLNIWGCSVEECLLFITEEM